MHGGVAKDNLKEENIEALQQGIVNLERHVNNVRKYGLEPVVALNAFIHDTDQEIEFVKNWAQTNNVRLALTEVWEKGGKGGTDLAKEVLEIIDQPQSFKHLYDLERPLEDKIKQLLQKFMAVRRLHFLQRQKSN